MAAENLRRNDPVKRVAVLGVLLVAFSLVWYSKGWLQAKMSEQKLNQIQAQVKSHTNDFAIVQDALKRIEDTQHRLDSLNHLSEIRFLEGNLLNALQQVYVPNVQLTRIRVGQNVTSTPSKPPVITEHITLSLDARDFSPNPGDQWRRFKDALENNSYLKERLEGDGFRLVTLSPVQTGVDGKLSVNFALECHLTKP